MLPLGVLCFITGMMAIGDPLAFLYNTHTQEISTKYMIERATLVLVLNTTFLTAKSAVVEANVFYKKWASIKAFQDASLGSEYSKALEVGKNDFIKASQNIENLYSYLVSTGTADIGSNCIFYEFLFPEYELFEFEFVKKKMSLINKEWAVGDINGEKRLILDTFALSYNMLAEKWYILTEKSLKNLELIFMYSFPVDYLSNLETLSCIQDSNYEMVQVLDVKRSTDKIVVELQTTSPNE